MQPNKKEIIKKIDIVLRRYDECEVPRKVGDSWQLSINTYLTLHSMLSDLIHRYAPVSSAYHTNFIEIYKKRNFENKDQLLNDVNSLHGILRALRVAYADDLLQSIEELIRGDMFEDFLEMAQYLLDEKYKDPAAMLIGGVLEEHIRKLCQKNNIAITKEDKSPQKTSTLNDELVKAGVYKKGDQKSVISWLDIRNNSAHGKYGEYTIEQVELMLQGIRDFIIRNPA
jgi:hypothetical protein